MLTLGIDPGTATTGYGLIAEDNNKLVFVEHGIISTSPKDDAQTRLKQIYGKIKAIIANRQLLLSKDCILALIRKPPLP